MKYDELVELVGDEAMFESSLLLAGDVDPGQCRQQLARWKRANKVIQIRRGLYALAAPYRKVAPHPFAIANRMSAGSYVSTDSALAHHGLIPEHVPVVTSVTTTRSGARSNALGRFDFRHIKTDLFWGYRLEEVAPGQKAFVALPEKALLDKIYLHPGAADREYLTELRLQNTEGIDPARLREAVDRAGKPKLGRALPILLSILEEERETWREA